MKPLEPLARIARQPLVHFLLIGAVLFVADRYVSGEGEDPRRIVIDDGRRTELRAVFEDGQGRAPTSEELQDLMIQWSQNEVLYREAQLMGLDRGDEMIRQRLILKLRNIVFGNAVIPEPTEEELQSFFEANRSGFDRPALFDFEQFPVSGEEAETLARQLAEELDGAAVPPEYEPSVRRYAARSQASLAALFGEKGARQLIEREDGSWIALRSERDWRLVRITERRVPEPVAFEQVRGRVARQWQDLARKAVLAESLASIAEQYAIEVTGDWESEATRLSQTELQTGTATP